MTLEDLHASLPPELRVTPDKLPEDIRAAWEFQAALGALTDAGTPEDQLPTFEVWQAGRG